MKPLLTPAWIERRIYLLRGFKVMLSTDLAELYQVKPGVLIQAVKRNIERFPEDFMFQVSKEELLNLKSQIVISSWGGSRVTPFAFSEQGIAMLSSVLRSSQAVQVNISIMRTFVQLREMISSHQDLARKLTDLEQKYDHQFRAVFEAIREILHPPVPPRRKMGI